MQENCKPGERRKAGDLLHKVRILTVTAVGNLFDFWKVSYKVALFEPSL